MQRPKALNNEGSKSVRRYDMMCIIRGPFTGSPFKCRFVLIIVVSNGVNTCDVDDGDVIIKYATSILTEYKIILY